MIMFDPLYLLLLAPAMLLAFGAQMLVKSAYAKASRVPAHSGLTGAEAAEMIMRAHGITNVPVRPTQGFLSDHYDPRGKVLRLSPGVYEGRSVAALGIAAHEAGHAVQDKVHYAPLKLRNGIVPLAAVGSNASMLLFILGLVMGGAGVLLGKWLMIGAIVMFSMVVLFQLINLPVEFDASRRAKDLLKSSNMVAPGREASLMSSVLNAAALTYVAGTLTAIMTLLYFVLRSGLLSDRR